MSEQLKPCPFCGLVPILKHYQRGAFVTDYWVTCPQCKIEIGRNGVPSKAIAAWNHRPADPVKQELAEALRDMILDMDHQCKTSAAKRKAETALSAFEKEQAQ